MLDIDPVMLPSPMNGTLRKKKHSRREVRIDHLLSESFLSARRRCSLSSKGGLTEQHTIWTVNITLDGSLLLWFGKISTTSSGSRLDHSFLVVILQKSGCEMTSRIAHPRLTFERGAFQYERIFWKPVVYESRAGSNLGQEFFGWRLARNIR